MRAIPVGDLKVFLAVHAHTLVAFVARVGVRGHLFAVLATLLLDQALLYRLDPLDKRLTHLLLHLVEPGDCRPHHFQFPQDEQQCLSSVKQRGHVVVDLEHRMRCDAVLVGAAHELRKFFLLLDIEPFFGELVNESDRIGQIIAVRVLLLLSWLPSEFKLLLLLL